MNHMCKENFYSLLKECLKMCAWYTLRTYTPQRDFWQLWKFIRLFTHPRSWTPLSSALLAWFSSLAGEIICNQTSAAYDGFVSVGLLVAAAAIAAKEGQPGAHITWCDTEELIIIKDTERGNILMLLLNLRLLLNHHHASQPDRDDVDVAENFVQDQVLRASSYKHLVPSFLASACMPGCLGWMLKVSSSCITWAVFFLELWNGKLCLGNI